LIFLIFQLLFFIKTLFTNTKTDSKIQKIYKKMA
jgi:hypothetical protein